MTYRPTLDVIENDEMYDEFTSVYAVDATGGIKSLRSVTTTSKNNDRSETIVKLPSGITGVGPTLKLAANDALTQIEGNLISALGQISYLRDLLELEPLFELGDVATFAAPFTMQIAASLLAECPSCHQKASLKWSSTKDETTPWEFYAQCPTKECDNYKLVQDYVLQRVISGWNEHCAALKEYLARPPCPFVHRFPQDETSPPTKE